MAAVIRGEVNSAFLARALTIAQARSSRRRGHRSATRDAANGVVAPRRGRHSAMRVAACGVAALLAVAARRSPSRRGRR